MKHLFSIWDVISEKLRSRYIYLMLDCDGTLAPIADTPDLARIPEKIKEVLATLLKCDRLHIAIISGRSLKDLKAVVGLDRITYVGNHGLEVEGEDMSSEWRLPQSYKKSLIEMKDRLMGPLADIPGAFIEDKGLSLCLHYRMANISEDRVRAMFDRAVEPYVKSGQITIMRGKKIIEIRPAVGWDKGKIVKWLLTRQRLLVQDDAVMAVYAGDDLTDEAAFKALGDDDISILVGKDALSSARYQLDDVDQIHQFLVMLLKLRTG